MAGLPAGSSAATAVQAPTGADNFFKSSTVAMEGRGAVGPSDGLPPLRVLLVDDDPLVHQTVAALREDLGDTVLSAQRAQQASDLLESGAGCEVLLTDFAMPGMAGRDFATAARALRPNLAAILATIL